MQLPPDTLLQGRYRVLALIAQGGMGAVYRARDERLGHIVALKQTLMADPALRAAFEREARLLAALHHPALPVVSDHFAEDGGQFLVMQYIPGEDLAAQLRARGAPFPPAQVLAWADQILAALEYLHGQRQPIVHRDIKPQNLKLAPHGGVILLDFGLAKGMGGSGQTASPSLFGYTPQYAPIEQIQGSGTEPRSDLYSLAASLYELLVGAPPPDALVRAAAIVRGEPDPLRPLLEIDPGLPAHVCAVLEQALSLNSALRPPSAAAMRAALASSSHAGPGGNLLLASSTGAAVAAPQAATGPTIAVSAQTQPAPAPSPPAPSPNRALLVGGAVAVAVLLLVAIIGGLRAAPATSGPVADAAPSPSATSRPALGASFAEPVPYGSEGAFGPLRLRVLDSRRGREAWSMLYAINPYNEPPRAGAEYVLVQLALESSADLSGLYPRLAGDRRVLYTPSGVTPAPLPEELAAGDRAEAWVAYLVAEGEQDLVLHIDSLDFGSDLPPLFMAADEGVQLEPDLTIAQIAPNEHGVSHTAPAPLGAAAVAEDYELTVLEALRGPEVLEALVANYAGTKLPRDGYEYALVRMRVRYLGDGGVIGWASIGPINFRTVRTGAADPAAEEIEHPSVYVLPDDRPELSANLLPGGAIEGWTVVELPVGADDVALVFSPSFDLSGLNTRYLALW